MWLKLSHILDSLHGANSDRYCDDLKSHCYHSIFDRKAASCDLIAHWVEWLWSMKSTRRILGHLLLRSVVLSHRSLIRWHRSACFSRALCCAHSFARSLTHSLRSSRKRGFCSWNECFDFIQLQPTVARHDTDWDWISLTRIMKRSR